MTRQIAQTITSAADDNTRADDIKQNRLAVLFVSGIKSELSTKASSRDYLDKHGDRETKLICIQYFESMNGEDKKLLFTDNYETNNVI